MVRSDDLESAAPLFCTRALASDPAHSFGINNIRRAKRNLGKHSYLFIEPASGDPLQIVAYQADEDHVRLRLAAELQHPGHFSRWLDCLAKISGGVIKHLSKLCGQRVGRHVVGVPTAQALSSPLHFVCRVSKTFPPFSSMAKGHGEAPGTQAFCV